MSIEFPEATPEIKAILKNPNVKRMIEAVEELLLDDKDLTPEQWEYYQKRVSGKIDNLADDIKTTTKQLTDIKPEDSVEEKLKKLQLQKTLIDFLQNVFDKLKKTFQWIFQQIKNGVLWCWGKLKDAFSSFKKLFS